MKKKPSLSKALKLAESAAGLARALHVSASTVRRWKDGISEAGKEKLSRYLQRQDKLVERRRADRNRIHELMKLADAEGKLPALRSGTKERSGRLTVGVQHVKNFKLMLSFDVLDDIDVWLYSLKKRFSNWQLLAIISQYGVGEHRGYKTVYHQLAPDAGDFAISANVATPATKSLRDAGSFLREKLEEVIEGSKVVAFLHSVTAFNYNKRSAEQSSAWETLERRKREEKAKKWRKKEESQVVKLQAEIEQLRQEIETKKQRPSTSKAKPGSKKAKKGSQSRRTSQPSSRSSQPSKTTARAPSSKRARPSAPKASKATTKKSAQSSRQLSKKKPTRAKSKSTSKASVKRSKKASSKKKPRSR